MQNLKIIKVKKNYVRFLASICDDLNVTVTLNNTTFWTSFPKTQVFTKIELTQLHNSNFDQLLEVLLSTYRLNVFDILNF